MKKFRIEFITKEMAGGFCNFYNPEGVDLDKIIEAEDEEEAKILFSQYLFEQGYDVDNDEITVAEVDRQITDEIILREGFNLCESDIKDQLKDGIFVYTSYDAYKDDCIAGMVDEEDIPEMWNGLDTCVIDGITYHVDFVL